MVKPVQKQRGVSFVTLSGMSLVAPHDHRLRIMGDNNTLARGEPHGAICGTTAGQPQTAETCKTRIKEKLDLNSGSEMLFRAMCWMLENEVG